MSESRNAPVEAGIWIDHSRAVLVEFLPDGTERTRTLHSDVERGARSRAGAPRGPGAHRASGAEHLRLAERRRHALRNFYRRVWNAAAGCNRLVVLGPGLAPTEFTRAAPPGAADRIRDVEPQGRLSDAQLKAHVRELFGHPAPRVAIGRGPAGAD